jgi:hypothetical protein
MLILEENVSNEVVEYFDHFLENKVQWENLKTYGNCTVNGFQTKNILSIIDKNYISDIYNLSNLYIKSYYNSNIDHYLFVIDHLHLIKYNIGGYQTVHTHCRFEDHSFILYLNDCLGVTRVYLNGRYKDILPEKNKIVFFNSALFHEGFPCDSVKKVLVGSIKFLYKSWRNR